MTINTVCSRTSGPIEALLHLLLSLVALHRQTFMIVYVVLSSGHDEAFFRQLRGRSSFSLVVSLR